MRKFLYALALLLVTIFLIGKFSEVQDVVETLRHGDARFLALALVFQAAWIINLGASFYAIFHLIGLNGGLLHMVRMAGAANFLNVIAPAGGVSGIVIFLDDARRRGYSTARAAVAGALFVLFDYAGFICILVFGLIAMFRRNHLNWPEGIASLILILFAAVVTFLFYLGARSGTELGNALAWMAGLVNLIVRPFIHRDYFPVERTRAFATDAAEGVSMVRQNPRALILPFLLSISAKCLLIGVLYLVSLAFKTTLTPGALVAGFSMAYLFMIVSPTPQGIGVVEGALTLYLRSFGFELEQAAVVVLAYRGFSFWLPFFFGMAAFRGMALPKNTNPSESN
jgi:glycosyltransferase 2 family protein